MQVSVDTTRCCGTGQCVLIAPEVFDQDEEGIVTLRAASSPAELDEAVREAAAACPTSAIRL